MVLCHALPCLLLTRPLGCSAPLVWLCRNMAGNRLKGSLVCSSGMRLGNLCPVFWSLHEHRGKGIVPVSETWHACWQPCISQKSSSLPLLAAACGAVLGTVAHLPERGEQQAQWDPSHPALQPLFSAVPVRPTATCSAPGRPHTQGLAPPSSALPRPEHRMETHSLPEPHRHVSSAMQGVLCGASASPFLWFLCEQSGHAQVVYASCCLFRHLANNSFSGEIPPCWHSFPCLE